MFREKNAKGEAVVRRYCVLGQRNESSKMVAEEEKTNETKTEGQRPKEKGCSAGRDAPAPKAHSSEERRPLCSVCMGHGCVEAARAVLVQRDPDAQCWLLEGYAGTRL